MTNESLEFLGDRRPQVLKDIERQEPFTLDKDDERQKGEVGELSQSIDRIETEAVRQDLVQLNERPPSFPIAENITPVAPPEKKSWKQLVKMGEDPESAREYFNEVISYEVSQGRLPSSLSQEVRDNIDTFEPNVAIRDVVVNLAIGGGLFLGEAVGGAILGKEFLGDIIKNAGIILKHYIPFLPPFLTGGALAYLLPIDGLLRAPYLAFRSVQEITKLAREEGFKKSLNYLRFFAAINFLNLTPVGGWFAPMVSFPRNRDMGITLINHKVQTSRAPHFIKNTVNEGIQWFYKRSARKLEARQQVKKSQKIGLKLQQQAAA